MPFVVEKRSDAWKSPFDVVEIGVRPRSCIVTPILSLISLISSVLVNGEQCHAIVHVRYVLPYLSIYFWS